MADYDRISAVTQQAFEWLVPRAAVDAVFTTPVAAFLLDFTGGTVSPTLGLYDAAGALLMSTVAPDPRGKLRVRSDDGSVIARFTVSNGFLPDGAGERFYIDELQVDGPIPVSLYARAK